MKESTLIALVTIVIVFTLVGSIIGLFAFAFWEEVKLQQGELLNNSRVEVTDFQLILQDEIPVYLILELLAAGYDFGRIIEAYPDLKREDIEAAIEYASGVVKGEEVLLLEVEA